MITVSGLTKQYGGRTVVDDVSFTLEPGTVTGFLGPNGAGKSTTMRILTGFLPATSGTVKVAGFDVFEEPREVKRLVGYLPETPPVHPDLKVRSGLRFCAELKGIPRKQVNDAIEKVAFRTGVDGVMDRLVGNLSKGFRQRVGLAQALLGDPEVLVLDEPTVGLDPLQIREVRELVKGLAGEHTVILSTHILSEVALTCGKVLVIHGGRLVDYDTLDGLVAKHLPGRRVTLDDIAFLEEIYAKLVSPNAPIPPAPAAPIPAHPERSAGAAGAKSRD
ncbi:MAG TPA: ABC transporter ATP-binding protein [Anaeromyxobacteraceae bacterium]|nr:ABC transporter ATP-binding protein [Anaeromyxobacteraceae bacterium]